MGDESNSKPQQDHTLPNEDPEHNVEHKFESLHVVPPTVLDTEPASTSYDLYQERRANLLQQHPQHSVEANTPTENPKPLRGRKKDQPTFITGAGELESNVVHDNEAAKDLIEKLKRSENDTQDREDESKEVFITRDGDIQRGEDAIVAKALLEIKMSCSMPDKSFIESGPAEIDQTAKDKNPKSTHLSQPANVTDGITHEAKNLQFKQSEDEDELQDASVQNASASSQSDLLELHEDHTPTVDSTASDMDNTSHIQDDLDDKFARLHVTILTKSDSKSFEGDSDERELTQHLPASKVNEYKCSKLLSNKDVLKVKKKVVVHVGEVTAASTDAKIINEDVQVLSSKTTVIGREVSVGTAEAKLVETKVKTGHIVTKVKGAEVKAVAAGLKGLQAETGASVSVTTKASTTTAASVDATRADMDVQATVEAAAQGADCKTGKATITGVKNETKVSAIVTASVSKIKAGIAEVTGVETGATAEASAEATGIEVRAGTAQISGPKLSATASATAKAGTIASVGTATIAACDGIGAKASVSTQGAGVHAFGFQAGISGRAAVHASSATTIGCISIAPGLPKIGLGKGFFNFGFGGIDGQSAVYTPVVGDRNEDSSATPENRVSSNSTGDGSDGSLFGHGNGGHSDAGSGSGGSSWSGHGNMFPRHHGHDRVGAVGHNNITEEDAELNQEMSDVHLKSSKLSGTIRANVIIDTEQVTILDQKAHTLSQTEQRLESHTDQVKEDSSIRNVNPIPLSGVNVKYTHKFNIGHETCTRTLSWAEHGLKIHIAPGTLPETESECTFTLGVTCSTQSNFQFPPDVVLVSPMFYIKPSVKLLKPVTLEIEHCCDVRSTKDMEHLVPMFASTTSRSPPYKFEYLKQENFFVVNSWGQFTVSSFTWYVIGFMYSFLTGLVTHRSQPEITEGPSPPMLYFVEVFYRQVNLKAYQIVVCTYCNLSHSKKAVADKYHNSTMSWQPVTQFEFRFKERNSSLSLVLPKEDEKINGRWKITPSVSPHDVAQNDINTADYISRELNARWENEDTEIPGQLMYTFGMKGIDKTQFEISIDPQCTVHLKSIQQLFERQPKIDVCMPQGPQLNKAFKILLPIASDWENIATLLGLDNQIQTIASDNRTLAASGLREMLRVWLQQINPRPTWDALADAVENFNPAIANKIRRQYMYIC